MTVAFRVFVPITAAGQRGLFTPLPCIHLYLLLFKSYDGELYKRICFVKVKMAAWTPAYAGRPKYISWQYIESFA
jgi:hypothetical protein